MLVEKDIARVSIGSYVVSIAKQHGKNTIKRSGWVRDLHAIENLIDKGVERVIIDTTKQLADQSELDSAQSGTDSPADLTSSHLSKDNKNDTIALTKAIPESFSDRVGKAKEVFEISKAIQRKLLDDIVCGRDIDLEPVKKVTKETTKVIFENPDALACIINIRNKDDYLLEHSTSVSILTTIFARYLELDESTTQELAIGAFLHDVGKIKVPDKILNKPGKLTEEEFEVMKTHVDHSIEIISETAGISQLSLQVAALHHEKLDGTGYPHGLVDKEISEFGRMITICDIFDALSAHRVYKKGIAQVKAFAILLTMAESGALDSGMVGRFIKCMGVYPVGSLVKLSSNQLAVVESRNLSDPIRPKVKTFYSVSHGNFLESRDIDLFANRHDHIEKGVRAADFDLDMNKILEFLLLEG
jgi:HD-GYP domain-containing protein (c-di-GMP phosphodiesterase class II)